MKDINVTVIEPKTGWFDIKLSEVWHYRDLIQLFVRRIFVSQYKQTILGPAWAIIQPLITTVIFTVVFGKLAGLSAQGVPSFLFYFSGTLIWGYFSACLTQTATTFSSNAYIMGKVYFPRLVMPLTTVLSNLIPFAIQLLFFICFCIWYYLQGQVQINWRIVLLPFLMTHLACLALGLGIIVSAMTTKYRDLGMVVGFGVQLWMYVTPVAYDLSVVPEKYQHLYWMNPVTPVLQLLRQGFLGVGECPLTWYMLSLSVTTGLVFLGTILFSRIEKTFMDTI